MGTSQGCLLVSKSLSWVCFCTLIPAGALICFHQEVALKED